MKRFELISDFVRERAIEEIRKAEANSVVHIDEPTRTEAQSDKFHAMCSDVAKSGHAWMGKTRSRDQWKMLFISGHAVATKREAEMIPGLEGEYLNIRESTTRMGIRRMASLIEYVQAWCAMNGIVLRETAAPDLPPSPPIDAYVDAR